MGADGGSIAKRSELVPKVAAPVDRDAEHGSPSEQWTHCALTGEELEDEVVSDWRGALYNKTAVLRYLLGDLPRGVEPRTEIRQVRDVVELQREFVDGQWLDSATRKPIGLEGRSEAVAYVPQCGHVCSAKILLRSSSCPVCERSYEHVVFINPRTREAEANNAERHESLEQRGLAHSLKPRKSLQTKKRRRATADAGERVRRREQC